MGIMKYIVKKLNEKKFREEMERFYRNEYGSEWNRCEKMYPFRTTELLVDSCFAGKI